MANMPPDIWLYVADFIPDKVIYQLRCVNSVFLELAINIRWKEVTISTKQIYEAKKILDRISDPYISVRVRALTIHLASWEPSQNGLVLAPSTQHNIDYARRETTRKYNPTSTKLGLRSSDASNSIMNSLLNTCAGLTSLRKLTLDFSSISPVSSPQLGFGLFIRSLWPLVRKKLRHLFLKGTAQGYCTVLASRPTFPNLKELGMDLTVDPKLIGDCENSKASVLMDTLVPFLGKVNSRLEALRIKSQPCHSIPTDLSQLFIQMPFFPYLRTLEIRMPFNQNLLDPSGLKNLLSKSSHNLENVCLRLNPAGFSLPWALEGQLIPWLSDCLTEPQTLSCIQVLDIYPTGGNCDIVLGYIRRASKHLRSIVIRDRYFEADEVNLIIDAASHCPNLISLHLNIWELDINLFDQLYMKLPRLESLRLSTVDSFVDGYPRLFVNKLGDRCYNGWKLADISLCYGEREVDSRTMRALARSIPSVRSFFGRGHMRFEHH
ncbi:hypothetical protein JR316_0005775 [Psilocybe cubensis]|uniref:Uncharacterized protein n=2 Tax=Psilocybe cubensis TaxID=181762 RepID=A0ACB8H028_PSICU|nr:hypothetical protein JR316_0005775 [Psilocybe cubensis]KAH9481253.1 hypothetical protein JR316_0005775 [Psilocybe cubensis]